MASERSVTGKSDHKAAVTHPLNIPALRREFAHWLVVQTGMYSFLEHMACQGIIKVSRIHLKTSRRPQDNIHQRKTPWKEPPVETKWIEVIESPPSEVWVQVSR